MGARPGDCQDEGSFSLSEHLDQNLSNEESTECIATHFANIRQEFSPINVETLPNRVKIKIKSQINSEDIPVVDKTDVFKKMKISKKTKSGVPGDLPRRISKMFEQDLVGPLTRIFQNIAITGDWPYQWKLEHGIPLQKQNDPINEEQLRIISLTPNFSKQFEQFVME